MRASRSIHASAALFPRHTVGAIGRIPLLPPMIAFNSLRCIATTALAPGAMFSHPPPEPGADFNVVMVGAGVSLLFLISDQAIKRQKLTYTEHHVRIR